MSLRRQATAVATAWRPCKVLESTAEQWKHYIDLCGTWHGAWRRFSGDTQKLIPQEQFQAVCAPCVAADGESVHHVNRYPPHAAPKPGRLSDGLTEVDFGVYDKTNFQRPFGPHSSAAYGPGWAVMWPSTGGSERLAVELVSRLGDQRHRLVAVWRQAEGPLAELNLVTSITESLVKKPLVTEVSTFDGRISPENSWYPLHASAWAFLPWQLAWEEMQVGLAWQRDGTEDAFHGLIAHISKGQLEIQLPES